jgi:hypothetical protein
VLDAPVITRRVVSLAERLVDLAEQARTSRDELGVLRAVADFSLIPGADTRISAQVLTDVTYLGDAASGVDCPAREQLLGFIVSWVIALAPADQATALAAVLDSGSRPLRRAYARAAEELPDPGDAAWPRAVADRFSAWVTLGETHPEASSELLDRVLKPALQRPRRGERAALERELKARGRDVWSAWERWSDGRGRRRHR